MDPDDTQEIMVEEATPDPVVTIDDDGQEYDPYDQSRLKPAPTAGEFDPDDLTAEQAQQNLTGYYERSVAQGHADTDAKWYDTMHDKINARAGREGFDPAVFTAVVAALSPQLEWDHTYPDGRMVDVNIEAAVAAMRAHREHPGETHDILLKAAKEVSNRPLNNSYLHAFDILDAADERTLTGPKRLDFNANLYNPRGTRDIVTVDALMAQAAYGRKLPGAHPGRTLLTTALPPGSRKAGGYGWTQRRVHALARAVNRTPQEIQAIVWAQFRRENG